MEFPEILELNVTEDDIINGTRDDPGWCPVALSSRRKTGASEVIAANGELVVHTSKFDILATYRLSPEAEEFIKKFDARKVVAPIKLRLNLISKDRPTWEM